MTQFTYAPATEVAEKFGVTVDRLQKLAVRKDCPKNFRDSVGDYNIQLVGTFLSRIKKAAQTTKTYLQQKRKEKKREEPRRPRRKKEATRVIPTGTSTTAVPALTSDTGLTFYEFRKKFWENFDHWLLIIDKPIEDGEARNLVHKALHFGWDMYQTALYGNATQTEKNCNEIPAE